MFKLCKDVSAISIRHIIEMIRNIRPARRYIISEVITLVKLLLFVPATNSKSDGIFSTVRRVKNYLRSTTKDKRLKNLMILSVHKEITHKFDLIDIANNFVRRKDNRRKVFGVFT